MKSARLLLGVFLAYGSVIAASEPAWWLQPQRLIQTNLREIDATKHVDTYIASAKDSGANIMRLPVCGIATI